MSEKYSIVFRLSPNLYAENSPVIISSGALLKDVHETTISILLKIKNISNKNIKACRISIKCFDTVGNIVLDDFEYQYLDLKAARDSEFGNKTPIILPDNSIRSFEINISEVIFHDNSILTLENNAWESLSEALNLDVCFKDSELKKQFLIEYGENCKNKAIQDKDLWICACSKINKLSEIHCHSCGLAFNDIIDINTESLRLHCEERLQNEEIEKIKQAKEHKRKVKKIFISSILTVIVIIVIVIVSVINSKLNMLNKYNEALEISSSENCIDAIKLFEELGDYKYSKNQINKIVFDKKNSEKIYDYLISNIIMNNLEITDATDIDHCALYELKPNEIECLNANIKCKRGILYVGGNYEIADLDNYELYKISEDLIIFKDFSYYYILLKMN